MIFQDELRRAMEQPLMIDREPRPTDYGYGKKRIPWREREICDECGAPFDRRRMAHIQDEDGSWIIGLCGRCAAREAGISYS